MFIRPVEYFINRFHPKQEDAWLAYKAGLDLVLDHGRRSGKSELIVEIIDEDMEEHGKDCLYIALTQGQASDIIWPKLVKRLGGNKNWKPNQTKLEWMYLPANAKLSLKGADLGKDRLRGNAKRIIALDEFAFFKDPSIIKDVLAPMLVDHNGQFIYCSTPKGKNHFWKLKERSKREPKKYFTNHATMFDNPFLSDEGRQKVLSEYTDENDPLYRQEVLAEYIDYQGLVFALPQDTYTCNRWDEADLYHSFHWRGMDHGYSPDPSACVWVAWNAKKNHFLVYNEYKKSELLIHKHAQVINSIEPRGFVSSYSDIDPQVIAEYENVKLFLTPAAKHDKESKLLFLVNQLRTGRVKISKDCTQLLEEMSTYEWEQDGNDHLIDAWRYVQTNLVVPEEVPEEQTHESSSNYRNIDQGQYFGD